MQEHKITEQIAERTGEEALSAGSRLKAYVAAVREYQRMQRAVKSAKEDLDIQEQEVVAILEELGLDELTLESGETLRVKSGYRARMLSTDEDIYAKMREYSWAEGLVRDYIFPASLTSRVNETMEREGELPPEIAELVSVALHKSVGLTKTQRQRSG